MKKKYPQILFTLIIILLLFTGCEQVLITQPGMLVISFDKNDADATGTMDEQIIESGELVNINENTFIKPGWRFSGWAATPSGEAIYTGTANYIIETEDITLYAKWIRSYSVTYNGNGNSGGDVPLPENVYGVGETVTVLSNSGNLTKEGFSFGGWNRLPDGTGTNYSVGEAFLMGAVDIDLYAKWIVNHSVSFDKNDDGATGIMTDQSIALGSSVQLSGDIFVKLGWTFAGWAITPGGTIYYADEWYYTMGNSNVTLYASWTESPSHTVIFDSNSGSGTMADQSFTEGLPALLASNIYIKTGWSFLGWSTTPSGDVIYTDGSEFTIGTENESLYAIWTPISYSVVFDNNKSVEGYATGSMDDLDLYYGINLNLPECSFSSPYSIFNGWNTDMFGGGTAYIDGESFTVGAQDITLYAQWLPIEYTVTYDKNDDLATGEMTSSQFSINPSLVSELKNNSYMKTGYFFSGWNTEPDGSGIQYNNSSTISAGPDDITLYAMWTLIYYPVYLEKNNDLATGTTGFMELGYGMSGNLPSNGYLLSDYSFTGWNTASDGSGIAYEDESSIAMEVEGITLYAQWTINEYTVTYIDSEGTGGTVPPSTVHDYNSTVTVAGNSGTLVKEQLGISLILSGWNTEEDGSGEDYELGMGTFSMGASDIILYSKWTAIRAIGPAGGLIFYDKGIYSDGWRFLEAAPADQSSGILWSIGSSIETGASGIDIGTGNNNTNLIIDNQGIGSYAAQVCFDLSIVNNSITFDDWFLPSINELSQMIISLRLFNVGNFSEMDYWSSTEEEIPEMGFISAMVIDSQGSVGGAPKDDPLTVRAVRAF